MERRAHAPASVADHARVDPLPVLLLRRGAVSLRMLGVLQEDPRLELFVTDTLTTDWVAFAQKSTAVIAATTDDPIAALAYVATAGIKTPIVIAMDRRFEGDCADLKKAGAFACVTMPIQEPDLARVIRELTKRAGFTRVDGTLRLLLDPIGLVARYQDRSVHLSQREFAVLHCLSARSGRPVPADELLTYVWGESQQEKSRQILDVYIFQVRRKLEQIGLGGAITTVRGYGYALSDGKQRTQNRT